MIVMGWNFLTNCLLVICLAFHNITDPYRPNVSHPENSPHLLHGTRPLLDEPLEAVLVMMNYTTDLVTRYAGYIWGIWTCERHKEIDRT